MLFKQFQVLIDLLHDVISDEDDNIFEFHSIVASLIAVVAQICHEISMQAPLTVNADRLTIKEVT